MTGQGPKGIIMRPAHFPGRAPVAGYGNGGFRFADMAHNGSILCLPSGIYGWDVASMDIAALDDFAKVIAEAGEFTVLIIGTGKDIAPVPRPLREALKAKGVVAEPMGTGAAVRTYNVLLAEDRLVAAALIAID
jgi:uncharacterized protein